MRYGLVNWTALGAGLAALVVTSASLVASSGGAVSVEERIKGADVVAVAKVRSITSRWQDNEHGDRLIVSRVLLEVEETLKGRRAAVVQMDMDGGTLDGLTLRVSGQAVLVPGERAVVFLDPETEGVSRPHRRGLGVLKLDQSSRVSGSSIHVDDIRRLARTVGR